MAAARTSASSGQAPRQTWKRCLTILEIQRRLSLHQLSVKTFTDRQFKLKETSLVQPTGWPGCLVLKQGAVNQLFLGVFLIFLACLDHSRWAQFHLGILGPQE